MFWLYPFLGPGIPCDLYITFRNLVKKSFDQHNCSKSATARLLRCSSNCSSMNFFLKLWKPPDRCSTIKKRKRRKKAVGESKIPKRYMVFEVLYCSIISKYSDKKCGLEIGKWWSLQVPLFKSWLRTLPGVMFNPGKHQHLTERLKNLIPHMSLVSFQL